MVLVGPLPIDYMHRTVLMVSTLYLFTLEVHLNNIFFQIFSQNDNLSLFLLLFVCRSVYVYHSALV